MKFILVTNNVLVSEKYSKSENTENKVELRFLEGLDFLEVLENVRADIHKGHELLTHPLSGSIKPYETPYKSILMSKRLNVCGGAVIVDFDSLSIIEESVETAKKFLNDYRQRVYTEKHLRDFMEIDLCIIDSGVESALTGR